jgi:hypothetical protein
MEDGLDLGDEPVRLTHRHLPLANDGEPGHPALEVGERVDRIRQLIRLLDASQLLPNGGVGCCIVSSYVHDRLVQVAVHEEGTGARNIQEERPKGLTEQAILRPVLQ